MNNVSDWWKMFATQSYLDWSIYNTETQNVWVKKKKKNEIL